MIVCICRAVPEQTIREVVAQGAATLEEVALACRAGTVCGACRPTITEIIKTASDANNFPSSACSDCPRKAFDISSPYLVASGETL